MDHSGNHWSIPNVDVEASKYIHEVCTKFEDELKAKDFRSTVAREPEVWRPVIQEKLQDAQFQFPGQIVVHEFTLFRLISAYLEQCILANPDATIHPDDMKPEFTSFMHVAHAAYRLLDGGVPLRVGRFEVQRRIGHGGIGRVFLAFDPQRRQKVAIKVFPRAQARQAAREEVRHGEQHPNVVPIHDIHTDPVYGEFIAMKYIEGVSLHQLLKRERLTPADAASILCRVSDAVAHAHTHDVIHRDLKPANILLNQEGTPFVCDFGMATHDFNIGDTEGQIAGTYPYMAPEQIQSHAAGKKSDAWALGVILYEMLTGSRPFKGTTLSELQSAILLDNPTEPANVDGAVPPELSKLCMDCLTKNEVDRISVREVARALAAWLSPGSPSRTDEWSRYRAAVFDEFFDEAAGHTQLVDPRQTFLTTRGLPFASAPEEAVATDAMQWLKDWALEEAPVLLLANYGLGKSHLALKWFSTLIDRPDELDGRHPLFIPLRSLIKFGQDVSKTGFRRDLWGIARRHNCPITSFDQFSDGLDKGRWLLILDGIDEIPYVQLERDAIAILRRLGEKLDTRCPRVFTSRIGLFSKCLDEVRSEFPGHILSLSPWNKGNWDDYVAHCYKIGLFDSLEQFDQFRERVPAEFQELIQTPFYARMLVETREDVLQRTTLDEVDLYQLYIESMLKQRPLMDIATSTRLACVRAAAVHLCLNKRSTADLDEIAKIAADFAGNTGLDDIRRILDNDLTRTSLLVTTAPGLLSFSHKSLYEYLLASAFVTELNEGTAWANCRLLKIPQDQGVLQFVGKILKRSEYDELYATCRAKVCSTELILERDIVRNLLKVLQVVGRPLRNALLERAPLSGLDLSGFDVSSSNLDGASLTYCSLHQSRFSDCSFFGTRFVRSVCTYAEFGGCEFNDCDMSEINLGSAVLEGCKFIDCDMTRANLGSAVFRNCVVRDCELRNLVKTVPIPRFEGVTIEGCEFGEGDEEWIAAAFSNSKPPADGNKA